MDFQLERGTVTPIDAPGALADVGAKEAMYVSLRLRLPQLHNSDHDPLPNLVPVASRKDVAGLEMLLGQVFLGTLIAGLVSLLGPGVAGRLVAQLTSSSPEQGGRP
jgi:hypothetical protein